MLRSLRHDLQAQSRGHHAIDLVEERDVEKRKLWKIFLQRTKGAIVNQTNTGTVSKATLVKRLRNGVEHIWDFPSSYTYVILN